MKKEIKVEWCEEFIKDAFGKHHPFAGKNPGIEISCFWQKAEAAGLWHKGEYGGPMSKALEKLTDVECVLDDNGHFSYAVFRMKKEVA